jgi:integrase
VKYDHTSDANIKRHPGTGVYYFKRGKIEKSLKTNVWAEALERKKLLLLEIDAAGSIATRTRVGDLYVQYKLEKQKQRDGKLLKKKKIREGTYNEIVYIFEKHLLRFFEKRRLSQITPLLWAQYCDRAAVSDLANHRKVMSGFLKWSKSKGYILGVPDITEIPHHQRRKRRIIKQHELMKIFENSKGGLLVFLSLALYNGLRRKEIMTLSWDRVNLSERYIVIARDFNKKGRDRSLPINQTVANVLQAHRDELEKKGKLKMWVFPNRNDWRRHGDVSGLKTSWFKCLQRAGLEGITWHDFRATFEKYSNKSLNHTDMQKEKFADASLDVQGRIYVNMDHEDLRGLEDVVDVPGLSDLITTRKDTLGENKGKRK